VSHEIEIRGARTHNLQDITLKIPRDKLVIITGLSGSGKSSLAFDTLYAEGQRRYVESLSAYARQFLGMMEKPNVDAIEGLSPAISIDQKTTSKNPRSTVGTVTEIHDYLRLLFARIGKAHCPNCKSEITGQSVEKIREQIMDRGDVIISAPLIRGRKGQYIKLFQEIKAEGFTRVIVDGSLYRIEEVPDLKKQEKHDIFLVIDRVKTKKNESTRISESLALALEKGSGLVAIHNWEDEKAGEADIFSEKNACPTCGYTLAELEPRVFSFNSPHGACKTCQGLGGIASIDPDLLVFDATLSIEEGALASFEKWVRRYDKKLFQTVCQEENIRTDTPWQKLKKSERDIILWGSKKKFTLNYRNRYGSTRTYKDVSFAGIIPALEHKYRQTGSEWQKETIGKVLAQKPCPDCKGQRLSSDALAVTIKGKNIAEISALDIKGTLLWLNDLTLTKEEAKIASLLLKETKDRLSFLLQVGLDYLSLDRSSSTLSGGESQRIRLATQIGSRLVGVLYILDEPSIGLHPRDNDKLIRTLKELRDLGNSLLVVEHDEATMLSSDWIIDLGPGAGKEGGRVVFQGTAKEAQGSSSITGQFLSGKRKIKIEKRRKSEQFITIKGANEHNLKDIDVSFALHSFNCLTGVSGSGKSTLMTSTLYPALANRINGARLPVGRHEKIEGFDNIDKVIEIDQSPIGRTPRSNPATYTGLFDPIRSLFSGTPEAKARGYKPGRFSFNVQGGRCETCSGDGELKIEMHFLPDVYVQCEACGGKRYNKETLEIRYKNKTIAEILQMTVAEALPFFKNIKKISRRLQTLSDVGLDYIHLGQAATTLSGGEAQRIKLATELSRVATGDTLYILDEPTTGLHVADIEKLLLVLQRLVNAGNTVIVIEHNLDVIKSADRIIDLGPEGGEGGGEVIAVGTPEEVCLVKKSYTGQFLKKELKKT
jgi:excinuclease ABC subunit A